MILNSQEKDPRDMHTEMHTELCPDFCNAHLAYEHGGTSVPPGNPQQWWNWYESPWDYEEPNLSRATREIFWTEDEINKVLNCHTSYTEKVIIMRLLPDFAKHAKRVFVGALPEELMSIWIKRMSEGSKPMVDVFRTARVPSHRPEKHKVKLRKTEWSGEMPKLTSPFWFMKKWVTPTGVIFRAKISSITFTHNNFNNLIHVDFIFVTEFHDGQNWCP